MYISSLPFPVKLSRVKLFAVFQGLREEGFDLSAVLATEFLKRCHEVSLTEEKAGRHVIQKLLKTGMSLGKILGSLW